MTSVSAHGDCIFPGKPSLFAASGRLTGCRGLRFHTRGACPILATPERHPQLLAQPGPSWELRLEDYCGREPGTALAGRGSLQIGMGALGRLRLCAPGRGGLCGCLMEGRCSGPRCPGRPDTRGLSLLTHQCWLPPGAIVSIYICLWSEVVTDQGCETLAFP